MCVCEIIYHRKNEWHTILHSCFCTQTKTLTGNIGYQDDTLKFQRGLKSFYIIWNIAITLINFWLFYVQFKLVPRMTEVGQGTYWVEIIFSQMSKWIYLIKEEFMVVEGNKEAPGKECGNGDNDIDITCVTLQ